MTVLTPKQAYLESAEFHYAAEAVSLRDGVSVSYVVERPGFVQAAAIAGELLDLHREMVAKLEALESITQPQMDKRRDLVLALADWTGIPSELLIGEKR